MWLLCITCKDLYNANILYLYNKIEGKYFGESYLAMVGRKKGREVGRLGRRMDGQTDRRMEGHRCLKSWSWEDTS